MSKSEHPTAPPAASHQSLPRRTVLATGAGVAVLGGVGVDAARSSAVAVAEAPRGSRFFAHGVASGDPRPDAVVIWTRVTPTEAASPGSGVGPQVEVRWEVAADPSFERVVRRGSAMTGPARDHTVKVDAGGLAPQRWYWYRFACQGRTSPVGRLRTAPSETAEVKRLRLGVASCANLQAGWFSAYRGLAARDDLDAVLHLGDYLYEYGPGEYGNGMDDSDVRPHDPPHEIVSLSDYRRRHAQYKQDPDLQALHAKYPWIITWDDHEVANDAYRRGAENHQPETEGDWLARRARAHRAYDEWMPVRMDGTAELGDGTRLYRRLRFGKLAEVSMLDLRTYRSKQVDSPAGPIDDPDRTITGPQQLRWLKESLRRPRTQWKVIGNPVMIAPVTFGALPDAQQRQVGEVTGTTSRDGVPYNVDQWDGYTADRTEIFTHIADHHVENAVFVTGDIHSAWACDLPYSKADYAVDPTRTAGVEFVCSSVTSNNLDDITGGPEGSSKPVEETIKANNPHIKYLDFDRHGFSVLDITPRRVQMDWYVLADRTDKDTAIMHSVSYLTRVGTGVVERAEGPVNPSGR